MKKSPVCSFIIPLVFTLLTSLSVFAENSAEENPPSLFETIASLDAELFAAFNSAARRNSCKNMSVILQKMLSSTTILVA